MFIRIILQALNIYNVSIILAPKNTKHETDNTYCLIIKQTEKI